MIQAVGDMTPGESVILSPLSVSVIMALTALGAKDGTAQEIRDSLSLPCGPQEMTQGYQKLTDILVQVTTTMTINLLPKTK